MIEASAVRSQPLADRALDDRPRLSDFVSQAIAAPLQPAVPSQTPSIAANDGLSGAEVRTNALLAEDVYRAEPTPPAGYRVASEAELDRLGITKDRRRSHARWHGRPKGGWLHGEGHCR